MCGIGGLLLTVRDPKRIAKCLGAMQSRLRHRGPDDEGQFISADSNVGLVHTRLSILDLSTAGHQPMTSSDGRYVIVFNGEIYNFRELKRELESSGVSFFSQTDTEVILRLYQRYGSQCAEKLRGMFAFAIWDSITRTCFLARDPLGIKPLYLWERDGCLAFASEIRAVLEADLGARNLDPVGLQGYLLYGSVQEPHTLVEGIKMLLAGHWMEWKDGRTRSEMYWESRFCKFHNKRENQHARDESTTLNRGYDQKSTHAEVIDATRTALIDSVRKHHVSDVPVSLFLSGGLDSTALLGLSKSCGFDNLRTFSISFPDAKYDEGGLASKTAQTFQTDHHDWRMEDADGQRLLAGFLDTMDQPSNDGFNTYCVSKFAHDHGAKVVLSGLGGDELFGGYPSFRIVPRLQSLYRYASIGGRIARRLASVALAQSSSARNQRLGVFFRSCGGITPAYWAMRGFFLPEEVDRLVDHYTAFRPAEGDCKFSSEESLDELDPADAVSLLETTRYMRNQLLRDSDVTSMAWGLELRVPLVDQQLIDLITRFPASIRLAKGKQLLCDAVPEIPEWVRSQSKRGFHFPFERWISQLWGDIFKRQDETIPVPLKNWYRRWSIYTLEHFLKVNQICTTDT